MADKKIRSIIIDDDPFIRELLQDKLLQYIPEVDIIGLAKNGNEGLEIIKSLQPDLIFLDVEMADMTGFEMLSKLQKINFQIIFITSYSHYAIKAIRFNALDYLLKPIDLGELKQAIKRYKQRIKSGFPANNIQQALTNINTPDVGSQKLILQSQEGLIQLPLKSILRVQGERNYSSFYLLGGKRKLSSKTLGDIEELLDGKGFFRCHKSHLVNAAHIKKQLNSFSILLTDDTEIPVSRRKKDEFKKWMESWAS